MSYRAFFLLQSFQKIMTDTFSDFPWQNLKTFTDQMSIKQNLLLIFPIFAKLAIFFFSAIVLQISRFIIFHFIILWILWLYFPETIWWFLCHLSSRLFHDFLKIFINSLIFPIYFGIFLTFQIFPNFPWCWESFVVTISNILFPNSLFEIILVYNLQRFFFSFFKENHYVCLLFIIFLLIQFFNA